jgi:hypothetical protein
VTLNMGAQRPGDSTPDATGIAAARAAPVGQQHPLSTAASPAGSRDGATRLRGRDGEGQTLSLLQALGSIAAPVTAATALLYYFGWVRALWMYDYFGVNVTLLGLTTPDYLLRSITPMFLPLAAGALAAVLALQAHPRIRDVLRRRGGLAATAAPWLVVMVGSAVILWSTAVIRVHSGLPRSEIQVAPYVLAPLGLGVGLGLIVWGLYLRRGLRDSFLPPAIDRLPAWSRVAQAVLIVVLLALPIVWTVANYADATGTGTADRIARTPTRQPGVVIYSRQRLHIKTAGVDEQRLPDPQGSYRYRYVGLRLLVANDRSLFLISGNWFQSRTTLILPRSDNDIRVEFYKGQNPPSLAG